MPIASILLGLVAGIFGGMFGIGGGTILKKMFGVFFLIVSLKMIFGK